MLTPSQLSDELSKLTRENFRGVEAVFEAEAKLANAEYDLDTAEQKAFLRSEGTVAERNAQARLDSAQKRLERDIAKAEFNRIKLKLKAVESALMAAGTQARLLQVETRL